MQGREKKTFRNTKIETTKATKRNLISDDFKQLSVKLVISVDSKRADFSGDGSWCFEAETEETTTTEKKMDDWNRSQSK